MREMADIDFYTLSPEHKDTDPHTQTALKVIDTVYGSYWYDLFEMSG